MTVLFVVLLLLVQVGAAPDAEARTRKKPAFVPGFALVAHRGFPGRVATENTIAAFERARAYGARAAEFDVRISQDQQFVLMHDPGTVRTTTCDEPTPVSLLTLEWIVTSCVGWRAQEPIPTLGEALDWFAGTGMLPVVELKGVDWTPELVARLHEELVARQLVERTQMISFSLPLLRTVESTAPAIHTHLIASSWTQVTETRLEDSAANRVDGFQIAARDLSPRRVLRLRAHGYKVKGRSTNSAADWDKLRSVRVDGLLTDHVARFQRWRVR